MHQKNLGRLLRYFLLDYLSSQRNATSNTVRAYRDSLKLLLVFCATSKKCSVAELAIGAIDRSIVLAFLESIELDRGNSVITRNLRLTAIRSFFRCVSNSLPEEVERCRLILSIPVKRADTDVVDYLSVEEINAILSQVPTTTPLGRRDDALLRFLYNTGARVQEAVDVRASDLRLETPASVRLRGKGGKERLCPLWTDTIARIYTILQEMKVDTQSRDHVFINRSGKQLSRFGVRYILSKYVNLAANQCPSLARKNVHPHTFRHTTAMHLLQAGVDLSVIKNWLGHVNLATTHSYIEIDLEMKRKALSACNPMAESQDLKHLIEKNEDVISWLDSLK